MAASQIDTMNRSDVLHAWISCNAAAPFKVYFVLAVPGPRLEGQYLARLHFVRTFAPEGTFRPLNDKQFLAGSLVSSGWIAKSAAPPIPIVLLLIFKVLGMQIFIDWSMAKSQAQLQRFTIQSRRLMCQSLPRNSSTFMIQSLAAKV